VAARALPMYEELANNRMSEGGKKKGSTNSATHRARDDASKVFKVGVNAVQQAKALVTEAADLAEQVEWSNLSLAAAYEELQNRRRENALKEKHATRLAGLADACPGHSRCKPSTAFVNATMTRVRLLMSCRSSQTACVRWSDMV